MLDYLSGNDEQTKKYRAWVIGYGYLQMTERIGVEKGTTYESDFIKVCNDIIRKNNREFFSMRHFPVKKKVRFIIAWYNPRVYNLYTRLFC